MKNYFQEKQSFTQWWLWVLLFSIAALLMGRLLQGYFFEAQPPEDMIQLLLLWVFMIVLIVFFRFTTLKTKLTEQGIELDYGPFIYRKFGWEDIEAAQVVDYGFVGGWGMRYSFSYGWVYNVKGSKGLALKFKNGRKRLIGTQRPEELREAVQAALQS